VTNRWGAYDIQPGVVAAALTLVTGCTDQPAILLMVAEAALVPLS